MFHTIKNMIKANKESLKVPRKVRDIIPIRRIWSDGVFLSASLYSKTWLISDINYAVASYEDKKDMFLHYSDLLNCLEPGSMAKITINNRRLNKQSFQESVLLPLRGDELDKYRREYNDILMDKAMNANNSIIQEKYITISVAKKSLEEARSYFSRIGSELSIRLSALGSHAIEMDANERLRIFHDFYRLGEEESYCFDIKESNRKGHHFADYVAPDSYESVNGNTVKLGEKYARVLFIRDYATYIKDTMLTEFCELSKPMMLSIDVLPIPTDEAIAEAQRRVDGVATNITNWQRSQNKSGNFTAEVPPNMEMQRRESREIYDDLTTRDQRLFFGFVSLVHLADSKDELDADTESLLTTSRKHMCQTAPLAFRQMEGLQTVLPFGITKMGIESFRTLNTESLAVLIPFRALEIIQPGGTYYADNAITKRPIIVDRFELLNGNGMILGVSGSGKSFFAKFEMIAKILSSGMHVQLIDPENEYSDIIEAMGGTVIRIAADSLNHIKAMDMSENYGDTENPIVLKSEFILSLCELVMGAGKLGAKEKSLIDRCIANVYHRYMRGQYAGQPPTLQDFHAELLLQQEPEAKDVALALELFTSGSLNTFAQQTNVDTKNRLICYNIRDLGKQLKTIGMLVVLDNIFNRITMNRERNERTLVLIDELYLLFANEYSANYLFELWKRIRKYGGICTGITQNIGDLLQCHTARTMLANSEFIVLLNQAPTDRIELGEILNITDTQLSHITDAGPGKGLIKSGKSIVPFESSIPRNTMLYKLMSTKFGENIAQ